MLISSVPSPASRTLTTATHLHSTFQTARHIRRLGSLVVKGVGLATRDSIPSHSTTSSAMDDRRRAGKPPQYFTMLPRPTQPPTLSGTGNEYPPKCGDALRLGSKGSYGSFHLWISVWLARKTVSLCDPSLTCA